MDSSGGKFEWAQLKKFLAELLRDRDKSVEEWSMCEHMHTVNSHEYFEGNC